MVHSKLVLTQVIKNMISCEEMKDQYVRTLDEGLRFRHGFIFISFIPSKVTGIELTKHTSGRHRAKWTVIGIFWINVWDPVIWNHFSLTVEKTRRYVNDISDDNLADFIDNFAKMVLIDYTKLDFPSLLVYLCQRRGTRKYIGDMFEVCQFVNHTWVMWHNSYTREYSFLQI